MRTVFCSLNLLSSISSEMEFLLRTTCTCLHACTNSHTTPTTHNLHTPTHPSTHPSTHPPTHPHTHAHTHSHTHTHTPLPVQWIDKIRTPRASNEARQRIFSKLSGQWNPIRSASLCHILSPWQQALSLLSGELQRRVGLKALDAGGNAVIGCVHIL